jgi:predicted AAA+ superfamily ATPase
LDDYVGTVASRDIQEIIGLDSVDRFESFMRLLATRVALPLNYSSLAGDLGVTISTVRRWTDALRRSYLIELIQPYSRNASQRVIKAPKMVFVDSALAQAAAREVEPSGFHLENLIATDLAVWQIAAENRGLYYWRLSSGQEVDFVLEQSGSLVPLEIKVSSTVTSGDARHLKAFIDRHERAGRGLLLSADPTIRLLGSGIVAAPWWSAI